MIRWRRPWTTFAAYGSRVILDLRKRPDAGPEGRGPEWTAARPWCATAPMLASHSARSARPLSKNKLEQASQSKSTSVGPHRLF